MSTRKTTVFYGLLIAVASLAVGMVIASRLDLSPQSAAQTLAVPAANSAPLTGPLTAQTFRDIAKSTTPRVMLPLPSPEITPPKTYGPFCEVLADSESTNCPCNRLLGGGAFVTVTLWWSLMVGSAVDVAVIVTRPPTGTALGALKVVEAPLAVCVGDKEPQAPGLPHVTAQSTPAFAESLLTVAAKDPLPLAAMTLFVIP